MPGRLLMGMQRADWGAPQLPAYAHGPFMQPEAGPWAMMGPPARDNLFARSTASRRFFSESMEYTPEVSNLQPLPVPVSYRVFQLLGLALQRRHLSLCQNGGTRQLPPSWNVM